MTTNTLYEKGRDIRCQGYPGYLTASGNPADGNPVYENNNLFLATGSITIDSSAYMKYSNIRVYGGMSGGPVMYKNSNNT